MYQCSNCNTVFKYKPGHYCDFCHESNKTITIKGNSVTISEIILDYDINTMLQLFPKMDLRTDEIRSRNNPNIRYGRTPSPYHINPIITDIRVKPLGFIRDNLDEFMTFSRDELNDLFISIHGSKPWEYTTVYVPIKCSISNDYLLMPMRLQSILAWFQDNETIFHTVYYNKSIWTLEHSYQSEKKEELKQKILDNITDMRIFSDRYSYRDNIYSAILR